MSLFWEKLARPVMFLMDPERAHELGVASLKAGLARPFYRNCANGAFGTIERFGLTFSNPLGLAAGFDKNGEVVEPLASLGFGCVEVGTVTLEAQPGNARPRLFRLPKQQALINRLGFNNDGAKAVADRLRELDRNCIVGVNIGRNRSVPNDEAVENYVACLRIVHEVADYITVNVSSPNTPELRDLQQEASLSQLLEALKAANVELGAKPLLVKVAPDLSTSEVAAIADICLSLGVSGVIATNTTITRPGIEENVSNRIGNGGLSGRPLKEMSRRVVETIYKHTKGKLPIIGVGGIFTAEDAFESIAAGASLVQAYTGFIYGGPAFPHNVCSGLAEMLSSRGFKSVDEAVGSGI
ncbi:MAG: quinone-dependent dihydroorotate dehydrogenase [Acidobacteria bacterium]|nr:quinone-dependent dihydroorotate dehydrogenase [Acidobacteriota bacterium]